MESKATEENMISFSSKNSLSMYAAINIKINTMNVTKINAIFRCCV
ncbi:hypothetical protein EHF_0852 [Ehrlichia japonica]|uniref:Uncharacterized protein n=1 Tax=Ehrlichia japonica TaxID=391036 RepID=X5GJ41_9RICK|nr:hypothetical protein EHF_0852 [Ehrlichia japonica]